MKVFFIIFPILSLINGECQKVFESGINSNDQKIITDTHNSCRLLLAKGEVSGQPRACNMKRVQYDANLANEAQKIANNCTFAHVKVVDTRWGWVGQNLYMSASTALSKGATWEKAIQSLFSEYKYYHYSDKPNSQTGHYTQIAWATTIFVGCGYTSYETSGKYKYAKLYVCNYGPGGNTIGIPPYTTPVNGICGCENLC